MSNIRKQGHEIIEYWSNDFEIIMKNFNLGIEMDRKGPLKITFSGILCWIFGLFFILIALGMIIEHEYFSAVFWFLAAFVSLSPISNLIESELNISVSGAVRFFVVIVLLAGSFAVYDAHTSLGSHSTIQDDMFAITIGNGITTSNVGYLSAPAGYEYGVVMRYIRNMVIKR